MKEVRGRKAPPLLSLLGKPLTFTDGIACTLMLLGSISRKNYLTYPPNKKWLKK